MTPKALNVYKEQYELKNKENAVMQDVKAWMNGLYVLKAIGCVLSKEATYPDKHMLIKDELEHELTEEEIEEIIHENTQIAASGFAAWARVANESWEGR